MSGRTVQPRQMVCAGGAPLLLGIPTIALIVPVLIVSLILILAAPPTGAIGAAQL